MTVESMQIRTMVSVLMAMASLFSPVQASSDGKDPEDHQQRQCGAISPLFLSLGDAYFDIEDERTADVKSAKAMEHYELLLRLRTMHFSQGSGVRALCIGSADKIRLQLHTVSLKDIEGRQTQGPDVESAISITAREFHKPSRRLARETVTIPTRSKDMVHLAGQALETSSRQRQATRIGSYLKETRIDAAILDNTITIDQSVYVNGTLAQWHTWYLSD